MRGVGGGMVWRSEGGTALRRWWRPAGLALVLLAAAPAAPPDGTLPPGPGALAAQETAADTVGPQGEAAPADSAPEGPAPEARSPGDPFAPLDLPAPGETRTASGAPGEAYWQQRADYRIRVTLHPDRHLVSGSETISYTNNSPDTLRSLWLQLDQNLFDPATAEARDIPEGARFAGAFEGGGYRISDVALSREGRREPVSPAASGPGGPADRGAGEPRGEGDGPEPGGTAEGGGSLGEDPAVASRPTYSIDGTRMEVRLAEPLPPNGGRVELSLDFAFNVPENGADRMGRMETGEGTIYEIAQWYPRMFVYDDVHGWNDLPYLGQGEFYLEYGSFDVEITVPRSHILVATGTLRNPEEVLTETQRARLDTARTRAETVPIVSREEVGDEQSRPAGEGPLTWKFHADSVRDFAWASSPAFIWDAAGWEDVLVMSVYPEEATGGFGPGWEGSTEIVRHAVSYYSEQWERYPYPVAINVAGPVLGMEYPMIVFCTWQARGGGLFLVTDHEIAHTWFPMLVGSDERRHAWMDEGFVTFMGAGSEIDWAGELSPGTGLDPRDVGRRMRSEMADTPVEVSPDSIPERALGFLAYTKPGAVLLELRDYVLGPERFDPAFRAYIDRWRYRHPTPADFFRTMEDVSGEDLDWFWRSWILTAADLDQAVDSVTVSADTTRVVVANREGAVMPLEVRFVYEDGSDECRHLPVEVWRESDRWSTEIVGKGVRNVHIDPRNALPDVDRNNNIWGPGIVARQRSCDGWSSSTFGSR